MKVKHVFVLERYTGQLSPVVGEESEDNDKWELQRGFTLETVGF